MEDKTTKCMECNTLHIPSRHSDRWKKPDLKVRRDEYEIK
jgi:hypothetical protein